MQPEAIDAAGMFRHLADTLGEMEKPTVAAVAVLLGGDGTWSAITMKGTSPLVGVALLEFAKTDLVEGGARWTEFEPKI